MELLTKTTNYHEKEMSGQKNTVHFVFPDIHGNMKLALKQQHKSRSVFSFSSKYPNILWQGVHNIIYSNNNKNKQKHTTPEVVSDTIKTLYSSKRTGPNCIPTKITKDEILIPLFNLIINLSILAYFQSYASSLEPYQYLKMKQENYVTIIDLSLYFQISIKR